MDAYEPDSPSLKVPELIQQQADPALAALLKPDLSELPKKECTDCGKIYPIHEDYFHRDSTKEDGFKPNCKECRNIRQMAVKADSHKKELDEFNKRLTEIVSESAANAKVTSGRRDNIGKLYEEIVGSLGGTQVLGVIVAKEIVTGSPQVRQKMLAALFNMSRHVTEMGLAKKNLEEMSREELEAELFERARAGGMHSLADQFTKRLETSAVQQFEDQVNNQSPATAPAENHVSEDEFSEMLNELEGV